MVVAPASNAVTIKIDPSENLALALFLSGEPSRSNTNLRIPLMSEAPRATEEVSNQ
jgi:hypothetical protein